MTQLHTSSELRTATPMPSFKVIERTLYKITEHLACELTQPTTECPPWTDIEWRIAESVVSMHGIAAQLRKALRWGGPDQWQAFLENQATHALLRWRHIEQLLKQIDAAALREGIALVALKGCALYDTAIYQPGERPMGDIDLLVHPDDMESSAGLLNSIGYSESLVTWRHKVFEPNNIINAATRCGEHIDNPIKIELHSGIVERLPVSNIDITSYIFPLSINSGLNPYSSQAALMRHLLLHAAGNMRARALRLIQLHDVSLLAKHMNDDDWYELFQDEKNQQALWWTLPPLLLTERYYPAAIPQSVIKTLEPRCSRWLRMVARHHKLVDVSWSKIRIQAFPGIEWSTSPLEAFKFMTSRIWPSRVALEELKQATIKVPSLAHPWYKQPHIVRILRWVISKPPRVQTMQSVRLAINTESKLTES